MSFRCTLTTYKAAKILSTLFFKQQTFGNRLYLKKTQLAFSFLKGISRILLWFMSQSGFKHLESSQLEKIKCFDYFKVPLTLKCVCSHLLFHFCCQMLLHVLGLQLMKPPSGVRVCVCVCKPGKRSTNSEIVYSVIRKRRISNQ